MKTLSQRFLLARGVVFTFLAFAGSSTSAPAEDGGRSLEWPGFRGPGARGVGAGPAPPAVWDRTENVCWRVEIPGRGWSSPIVWGRRIFLTSAVNEGDDEEPRKGLYLGGDRDEPPPFVHRWVVLALDAETGRVLWERVAHRGRPAAPRHLKNSYASETPVTDGERVYAYFGNVGLFAYTVEGEFLWKRSWGVFPMRHGWGTASSPALHGERIYIVNDNEKSSFIACVDKRTGEEVWRVPRDEKSNWSTPFVWEHEGGTEIVTAGTGAVRSYDTQGKLLWHLRGMSSITIPTPFAAGGLVYVASGFVLDPMRPIYAIRPGGRGDLTLAPGKTSNEFIVWTQPRAAPYNPSPLVYQGLLYVLYDRGFVACYDAVTGKEVYGKTRLSREANAFTSSPWAYGGRIFCLSEDGDCFVLRAGKRMEVERVNRLEEMCLATPAISRGRLYIRTLKHLYAIGDACSGSDSREGAPPGGAGAEGKPESAEKD